jgi:hypothetical protein
MARGDEPAAYQDAKEVDESARIVRCRQVNCRMPIWWGRTKTNNKICPFDVTDGKRTAVSHWRTCTDRPGR